MIHDPSQVRSLDPTRMAREADPTCIGQRHGPYHFDLLSGAGYDSWGGRWDRPAACSGANFGHDPGVHPMHSYTSMTRQICGFEVGWVRRYLDGWSRV